MGLVVVEMLSENLSWRRPVNVKDDGASRMDLEQGGSSESSLLQLIEFHVD